MSIFAGLYSRGKRPLDDAQCQAIRRVLSRHPGETLYEYRAPGFYLVRADVGALAPARPLERTQNSVLAVAGEPIIADEGEDCADAATEITTLRDRFDAGHAEPLRHAQGTFCGAHYNEPAHALTLFADKLAVRPLYYRLDGELCVFATALRILESCGLFRLAIDLRGLAETAAFQFPLGDRTAYDRVRVIHPAEIIRVTPAGETSRRYWRWDECPPLRTDDVHKEVHRRFVAGVRRRLRGDHTVKATLSGGMDSRCVVGALHSLGTGLITFNNSYEGSLDQVFGRECARRLGTAHCERVRTRDVTDPSQNYKFLLQSQVDPDGRAPDRPNVIWTGEGGSVGLGHVYMDERMIGLARRNDLAALVASLPMSKLPRRLFRKDVADIFVNAPTKGAYEEVASFHSADPGRNVYLYFLSNDQRRHVAGFFDSVDLRRYEIQMPFYDASFLAAVAASPIDPFLGHAFYNDWLKLFPAPIWEVPWQSYPGHVPCPHEVPKGLIYQWSESGRNRTQGAIAKQGWDLLMAKDFPHQLLKWHQVLISYALHRFLGRDQEYVFNVAETIRRYAAATA
jgi:asparagine synthase (glutamine-hydrolysing)